METLNELIEDSLKDIYSAEKQFLKAMPKMLKKAQNVRLKQSIETHIKQTEEQCRRLEQAAKVMGIKPTGKVCHGAQGLVEECNEHLQEGKPGPVLDAAIIACAQKNEHYEITGYGTLCEWVKISGQNEVLELLKQNIAEEEETDKLLSGLAESEVNPQAAQAKPQEAPAKRTASKSASGSASKSSSRGTGSKTIKEKVSVR